MPPCTDHNTTPGGPDTIKRQAEHICIRSSLCSILCSACLLRDPALWLEFFCAVPAQMPEISVAVQRPGHRSSQRCCCCCWQGPASSCRPLPCLTSWKPWRAASQGRAGLQAAASLLPLLRAKLGSKIPPAFVQAHPWKDNSPLVIYMQCASTPRLSKDKQLTQPCGLTSHKPLRNTCSLAVDSANI